MKTLPLLLFAFGVSGCAQAPDGASAAEPAVIRGQATMLERIKMAPGADVTVRLVDATGGAVLASTTLEDVAGPPYPFALAYDPAKVRADGRYAIDAQLRGADGNLLFATDPR